jgi:Fe-S cluster biogenesis protein NfuA
MLEHSMQKNRDFQKRLESIAELLRKIEAIADPSLRTDARKLVELLMTLHGGGVERTLEIISSAGEAGQEIIDRMGRDEVVASLLVLYGLHPIDFETRVNEALEKARSFLKPHSGEVEIVSIDGGDVRVRLSANGHGCGSNPASLKEAVEELIYESAPDVTALTIDIRDSPGSVSQSFVPLAALSAGASLVSKGEL